jgi:hypothetical protein
VNRNENYQYPNAGYGAAQTATTTGYAQVQDAMPVQQPRFESAADRLANLPDQVAKAVHRLRGLADRYGGSVPEAVTKGEASGPVTSLAARFEASTSALDQLLGQLHAQIDRLERF